MNRLNLLVATMVLMACSIGHQLNRETIENKAMECDKIIIAVGQSEKVVLSIRDSLFVRITTSLKKDCYRGIYKENERSRNMFKVFLLHADNTILDLTVLDNEAGALIYQGNWLVGQDILIYDSQLINPIREALK